MISGYRAAQLCQAIYSPLKGDFDKTLCVSGVVAGIKYVGNDTVVALRGSITAQDWIRDLKIWPEHDAHLGFVADGFTDGIAEFVVALKPCIRGKLILCGHSLGAARACIIAALLPTAQLVLFGCPRPGFRKLRNLVLASGAKVSSFKNRSDPVCDMPYLLGMLGLYVHIAEPTLILSRTVPDDIIDDHEISLYVEALSVA